VWGTKDILLGVHGSGVDIEIGVDFDGRDVRLVSTRTDIEHRSDISSIPLSSAAGQSTRLDVAIMSVPACIVNLGWSYQ
jgi:hypothetical protein